MKQTKRWVILFLFISFFATSRSASFTETSPDEGMWLPMLIKRLNADELAKKGCKLSPEEIYDINHSSLKDAIVHFGGFCTAEIVSDQGLLFTNHHCGYDAIQSNSTEEHNYLDNGFWAKNNKGEIPIKGLFVSILHHMEDVTEQVLQTIPADSDPAKRKQLVGEITKKIQNEASEKGKFTAVVRDMFNGNQYYLFVYQTFRDIRLVGAPPQSLGKFGGDTDNWMWPRHTADFSIFRIYADKNNQPSGYNNENVPYKPKHFIPVSLKGYQESDFAMVMGFPGRTNRYAVSFALQTSVNKSNPANIATFGKTLETWKRFMDADTKIRILYSAKYAQLANGWKYYIGQNEGLKKLGVIEQKQKEETLFMQWVQADPERTKNYGQLLERFKNNHKQIEDYLVYSGYINNAAIRAETVRLAAMFNELHKYMKVNLENKKGIDSLAQLLKKKSLDIYEEYREKVDKELFIQHLLLYIKDIPAGKRPPIIEALFNADPVITEKNVRAFAQKSFHKSIFSDSTKLNKFIRKPQLKTLEKDPILQYYQQIQTFADRDINPELQRLQLIIDSDKLLFMKAYLEFNQARKLYPDANGTPRFTYGSVLSYHGKDAVFYNYKTTTEGVLQKYIPKDSEFDVPLKMVELIRSKDYGRYAENGTVPVSFLTTNDITGGNSGSPVLNANGELIGLAYDGNWEAMTGDLIYDPQYKRTIALDIRYLLFIVDKFAGADNLIKELKINE